MAVCAMAMVTMNAMATDYTDSLIVKVNGVTSEQSATVSVTEQGGKYEFVLKNFTLMSGGQAMGIGTIDIKDITSVDAGGGITLLQTSGSIQIANGEGDSPSGMWMGPLLGDVPIDFTATINGDKVYASIAITMATLGQTIDVTFGSGYQLPNSGFELFHKEGKIDEPNSWHSFASSKGRLSGFVKSTPHTFVSDVVRPGSAGSHSVLVTSTSVFGIVANGTITTGRMNAGGFSANDPANHAELDMSLTEKDSNGDPFYAAMVGRPDSLVLWVKFKQGTPNTTYPYATVSAAITDGTYYQDPKGDNTYKNVLASAQNKTIVSKDFKWQRIAIPFSYVDDNIQGKAVLITISTNATPGQGSGTDSLYVDDIEFVYNGGIESYIINGETVNVTPTGKGALVLTDYTTDDKGTKWANVTVYSQDLKKKVTQVIDVTSAGINAVNNTASSSAADGIYTLSGQRTTVMRPGQVYIVKQNGKTIKVVKR